MPSADQVLVKSAHSTMLWPWWVVLIAGSTGSALRPEGKMHVTSGPWDDEKVILQGQVLEVRNIEGLHVTRDPSEQTPRDLHRSPPQQH
jgi:hypothetical protein